MSSGLGRIARAPPPTKPRATAKGSRLCRRWLPAPLSRRRGLPPAAGLAVRPLALPNSHSRYPNTARVKGRLVPHAPACVRSPPHLCSSPLKTPEKLQHGDSPSSPGKSARPAWTISARKSAAPPPSLAAPGARPFASPAPPGPRYLTIHESQTQASRCG